MTTDISRLYPHDADGTNERPGARARAAADGRGDAGGGRGGRGEQPVMGTAEARVVLTNKMGMHARPSTQIAQTAGRFSSEVQICKDGLPVDAKSVLELLMLAAECGSELVIRAEGDDAEEAVRELAALIEGRFGEIDVDT